MTNYADGTGARLGDIVIGRTAKSGGAMRTGVLTSIANKGGGAIHYLEVRPRGGPRPEHVATKHGDAAIGRPHPASVPVVHGAESASGELLDVYLCVDACQLAELLPLAAVGPVAETMPAAPSDELELDPESEDGADVEDDDGDDQEDGDDGEDEGEEPPPAAAATSPQTPEAKLSRKERKAAAKKAADGTKGS